MKSLKKSALNLAPRRELGVCLTQRLREPDSLQWEPHVAAAKNQAAFTSSRRRRLMSLWSCWGSSTAPSGEIEAL